MTLTILRPHPGFAYESHTVARSLFAALPLRIEADGPYPRTDYAATCKCQEVFRISEAGVVWLRKHGLLREALRGGKRPCVCRCMVINP